MQSAILRSFEETVARTPSYIRGHGAFAQLKAQIPSDARVRARTALFPRPRLARWVAYTDVRTRLNLPAAATELVIDGFQRSATTYAVVSFERANQQVRLSHHLHSPLSLFEARRFGVPMILTIRNPRDASASYLQFEPSATPLAALRMYTAYYAAVLPYLGDVVVSDFAQTTRDFASVVLRCNQRFGTDFIPPPATSGFDRVVRDTIQEGWNGFHSTPLPSEERKTADAMIESFDARALDALAAADEIYARVLARQE